MPVRESHLTSHYSLPFESLLSDALDDSKPIATAHTVIVGTGYGGSVAAYRLSNRSLADAARKNGKYDVLVLERGKEYSLGEFPNQLADLPGHVALHRDGRAADDGNENALFHIHTGEGVDAIVGSGLGGTSLINGNVAIRQDPKFFKNSPWPKAFKESAAQRELQDAYDNVTLALGVATNEDDKDILRSLIKYQAFDRFSQALEGKPAEPAEITVALHDTTNEFGIKQPECTLCGNCVTGCNVGSKNTLAMNLIPAAEAQGASFYTGASVLSVEPVSTTAERPAFWRVRVIPTSKLTRAKRSGIYTIEAQIVILSAGTLGTTEILQRSQHRGYVSCSTRLGKSFSTNGDGIAMSFAEREAVNAMGSAKYNAPPPTRPGPTITALTRGKVGSLVRRSYLLEDGVVPAPLLEIYGEIVTTAAQFGRLGFNRLPAWFRDVDANTRRPRYQDYDPLAVHRPALQHGQVFLTMCDDNNGGQLGELKFDRNTSEDEERGGHVHAVWTPGADGPNATLRKVDDKLAALDRGEGLSDGQYVSNPLWKLLPDSAASGMSGEFPGGRQVTVHPLGGCGMGDSAKYGVVDDRGRVFKRDGGIYQGLYVMDGSMIPATLGFNPFFTIAMLAWRACEPLAKSKSIGLVARQPLPPMHKPLVPDGAGNIVIREQLTGALAGLSDPAKTTLRGIFPGADRWFEQDGLILRVESNPTDTQALLTGQGRAQLTATLRTNPVTAGQVRRQHTYGVPKEHLEIAPLIASGRGTITVMEPDYPTTHDELLARRKQALRAYLARRKTKWYEELLKLIVNSKIVGDSKPIGGLCGLGQGMLSIAEMQATYRLFRYDLTLQTNDAQPKTIRISGEKVISWSPDALQLWRALSELRSRIEFDDLKIAAHCIWKVDMKYLVGEGLFKVDSPQFVPNALFNSAAFLLRLARSILQSAFWEFGAPEYPFFKMRPKPMPPDRIGKYRRRSVTIPVDRYANGQNVNIALHRYGADDRSSDRPVVLLIHGLAQGSLIYAHPNLPKGMARYFLEQNYNVWLLDLRISNIFTHEDHWDMDVLGNCDVPNAVRHIFEYYKRRKTIHVFAHCVGAVAMQMAILNGKVTGEQVASFAMNAIHPWTIGSPYNRMRAKLGVFLRDFIRGDYLVPIIQPTKEITTTQTLMDRLAFSIARFDETATETHSLMQDGLANAICDRMTFLYGRMWRHDNVRSIHPHWVDLMGHSPGATYRHLYYLLTRNRLVNNEGENVYLQEDNLKKWMGIRTLFMHGEESEVFNPQSATRSAIRLSRILEYLAAQQDGNAESTVVGLKRFPGYGHMDPILADSAATQSFPYLHHFFEGNFDDSLRYKPKGGSELVLNEIDPTEDSHLGGPTRPVAGLILRAARLMDGRFLIRFWVELPTMSTSPIDGIKIKGPALDFKRLPPEQGTVEDCYWWVDAKSKSDKFDDFTVETQVGGSNVGMFSTGILPAVLKDLLKKLPALSANTDAGQRENHWSRRLVDRRDGKIRDFRFIVASCCYPGTPFDHELSDIAFKGIDKFLSTEPCDMLFLIGDQIYADASAGLFDPIAWRDRYIERYRNLFRSENAATVLASIPTHFAIDDHEIGNDYAGVADDPTTSTSRADDHGSTSIASGNIDGQELAHAIKSARSYLSSLRKWYPFGTQIAQSGEFWYALDDKHETGCPAFILDTRSQRQRAKRGVSATVLDQEQLSALKSWLVKFKTDPRPKFIFSGSVIAPLTRDYVHAGAWMREDGLAGYPEQLGDIIAYIVDCAIQRIVFVGGDLHLSCAVKMELLKPGKPSVSAIQIVSSGLYAPLPFANLSPDSVQWEQPSTIALPTAACSVTYTPEQLDDGAPHFVAVSAVPVPVQNNAELWRIDVCSFDANGRSIKVWDHTF